jgi:hypothetical protein
MPRQQLPQLGERHPGLDSDGEIVRLVPLDGVESFQRHHQCSRGRRVSQIGSTSFSCRDQWPLRLLTLANDLLQLLERRGRDPLCVHSVKSGLERGKRQLPG